MYSNALVLGGGAFGTALASVLAKNFEKVVIKVRSEDVYDAIKNGENSVYLPGLALAENIVPALTWEEADELMSDGIQVIISGLPAAAIKSYFTEEYERFAFLLQKGIPIVSLSKGIDPDTLELPDDLFFDLFPKFREQFVFLSGPSFAKEMVQEQITLVTIAGRSKDVLTEISSMLSSSYFKALPSYDVKGVLLGGALKNVLAIAGGIIEGLGYNYNTRAAMITRGITEMLRFGKVFNARPETFYGLSGMGDLILTTTGGLSRNKSFGLEIAKGAKAKDLIKSQRSVVEGYKTARAVHFLTEKYGIRAKIFGGVYDVLYNDVAADFVVKSLMQSAPKFEVE